MCSNDDQMQPKETKMIIDWPPNSQYKEAGEGMQLTVLLNKNKCIKIKKKGSPKKRGAKVISKMKVRTVPGY